MRDDVPIPTLTGWRNSCPSLSAAAINPIDWKVVKGTIPLQSKSGVDVDVCGTIVEIAKGTKTDLKVGDVVYGYTGEDKMGTFEEYVRVSATKLAL